MVPGCSGMYKLLPPPPPGEAMEVLFLWAWEEGRELSGTELLLGNVLRRWGENIKSKVKNTFLVSTVGFYK